jgi:IS5 family transposase
MVGRTQRVVAQARSRLAGVMPESAHRLVSLHDADARPIRKGRLGKPVEFGYKAQIVDNADGVILDHNVEIGNPADAPQLAPAIERITRRTGHSPRAVTADRGYGYASVERDLHDLGVRSVAIPRASKPGAARREFEHRRAFRDKVKWRTGSEGRINHIKRSYGWNRPNSPASTAPEPGADTASSPTTSSRSAPSQHETDTRTQSADPRPSARRTGTPRRTLFQVEVASRGRFPTPPEPSARHPWAL